MFKFKKFAAAATAAVTLFGAAALSGTPELFLNSTKADAVDYSNYKKSGNIYYEINYYDEVCVVGLDPNAVNITIPEKIDGYSVTKLDCFNYDNESKKLKTLSIPTTVTSIEYYYYSNDLLFEKYPNLQKVTVASGNKNYKSVDGVLYEINENGTLTLLGYPAAKKETTHTLPNDTKYISDSAGINLNQYLTDFKISSKNKYIRVYDGVAYSIDTDADGNKTYSYLCCPGGKTSVSIPEWVGYIGGNPYYSSSADFAELPKLKTVTIPDSVKIGANAFYNTPLIDEQEGPVRYADKWVVRYDERYGGDTESVTIKDGTVGISDYAFGWDTHNGDAWREDTTDRYKLKNITLPDSIKYIGERAFSGQLGLETINLPEGLKEIGFEAFRCCLNLKSIVIPDSVTSLGGSVFESCTALENAVVGNGLTDFGVMTFFNCSSMKKITIPKNVTGINSIGGYYTYDEDNYGWHKNEDLTIFCYSGSESEQFAIDNEIKYVLIDALVPGDADGDGVSNMQDYALVQRFLAGWEIDIDKDACDLNGDNEVNMLDYALFQRKLAGWDIG